MFLMSRCIQHYLFTCSPAKLEVKHIKLDRHLNFLNIHSFILSLFWSISITPSLYSLEGWRSEKICLIVHRWSLFFTILKAYPRDTLNMLSRGNILIPNTLSQKLTSVFKYYHLNITNIPGQQILVRSCLRCCGGRGQRGPIKVQVMQVCNWTSWKLCIDYIIPKKNYKKSPDVTDICDRCNTSKGI